MFWDICCTACPNKLCLLFSNKVVLSCFSKVWLILAWDWVQFVWLDTQSLGIYDHWPFLKSQFREISASICLYKWWRWGWEVVVMILFTSLHFTDFVILHVKILNYNFIVIQWLWSLNYISCCYHVAVVTVWAIITFIYILFLSWDLYFF